jgi:DNA-directed RNA polymerase specialized sigma24 family protein
MPCDAFESLAAAGVLAEALEASLAALEPADRQLVGALATGGGIATMARQAGLPERALRTRLDRVLRRLRRALLAAGITLDDVRYVLDGDGLELLERERERERP